MLLASSLCDTPLGPMRAIADQQVLYFLSFADRLGLEKEMRSFCKKTGSTITDNVTDPICAVAHELAQYFAGNLLQFTVPIALCGTPFQEKVWQEIIKIPHGQTRTYAEIAHAIESPLACRAVAQVHGANRLAIIIPCHRTINTNGMIGGYNGGLNRKQGLLEHENRTKRTV